MKAVSPETPIHVKIIQTPEGPKFCTVLPMVEPKPEEETWPQSVRGVGRGAHRYSPADYDNSLVGYVQTRADQEA